MNCEEIRSYQESKVSRRVFSDLFIYQEYMRYYSYQASH
jgi:hypothetical protein